MRHRRHCPRLASYRVERVARTSELPTQPREGPFLDSRLMRQSIILAAAVAVAMGCANIRAAAPQSPGEDATAARLNAVRGDSARLLEFLRAMPKGGDLHNHLSGAVK